MPTHPLTKAFPPGKTARVTVQAVRETPCNYDTDSPERLYDYWRDVIATQPDHEPEKESLVVVLLTSRLRPFAWHRVSLGTLTETSAHPREVMRPVIVGGAYAFAMLHNHPSGDPSPSNADTAFTRRIVDAAEIFQIRLLDHVIAGEPAPGRSGYYSYRENCLI